MTKFDPNLVQGLEPVERVVPPRRSRRVRGPTLEGRVSPTVVQPLDDPRPDPLLAIVANAHGWTARSPRPPGKKTDVEGAAIPLTPWWRIALDVGRAILSFLLVLHATGCTDAARQNSAADSCVDEFHEIGALTRTETFQCSSPLQRMRFLPNREGVFCECVQVKAVCESIDLRLPDSGLTGDAAWDDFTRRFPR
jgi:hypothetical protein